MCPINAIGVWDNQADIHILDEIPFRVIIPTGSIAEKTKTINGLSAWLSWPENEDTLTILVMNYASTIKRDRPWAVMKALQAYAADFLVFDESHHIKNATAKQSRAAHILANKAPQVMILTGTPIGKNYLDLYSQLKAIDPDIWKAGWTRTGNMSWTDFRNHYGIYGGRTGYELKGYRNLPDLKSRYMPHIRTARKESIHDMPKVTDSIVPVEMNASARRVYNVFADEGMVVHKRHLIEAPIPLTKLLRLQQMTGGWVGDEHGERVEIQLDKLAIFTDLVTDLAESGKSVVVFARFIAEMDAIYQASVRPYKGNVYQIRGGVSSSGRRAAIQDFGRDRSAIVVQVAAAEALDGLQDTCSYGVFYSTDYSLIHWNQARGRLDRVGQKEPVTFYHLQATGTVDSLILQALKDKKDVEKIVMDNPKVLLAR